MVSSQGMSGQSVVARCCEWNLFAAVFISLATSCWSGARTDRPSERTEAQVVRALAVVPVPASDGAASEAALELEQDVREGTDLQTVARDGAPALVFVGERADLESELEATLASRDFENWKQGSAGLAPETFLVMTARTKTATPVYVIAGGGPRGVFYGAHHFSEVMLGIPPGGYWLVPQGPRARRDHLGTAPYRFREHPPAFPLRGYFDNDDDMLANWTRADLGDANRQLVVEAETWREMIDTLSRLRYNFIDLHDTLGRTEFFAWSYYTERVPDYEADPALIREVIAYAHRKGMLVQVPLYLGWEFLRPKEGAAWRPGRLTDTEVCYSKSADRWHEVLDYLLNSPHSPVKDADIFLQRPRHPFLDHPYSPCPGEETGEVMTRWINHMHGEIKKANPNAILVVDLWHEGREMWKRGTFRPDPDIPMVLADRINGDIGTLPNNLHGYDFGLYLHAGVWLNHVVQDPIPARLGDAIRRGHAAGLDHYLFVNGQDFKHFLLGLEAASRAAWEPEHFDGAQFQREWASRYFGAALAEAADTSLNALRTAHEANGAYGLEYGGYRLVTERVNQLLRGGWVGKFDGARADAMLGAAKRALDVADAALSEPTRGSRAQRLAFDDQIRFPAAIYFQNLLLLDRAMRLRAEPGQTEARAAQLREDVIRQAERNWALLRQGSAWPKWQDWTAPEHFRVFTPPLSPDEVRSAVNRASASYP